MTEQFTFDLNKTYIGDVIRMLRKFPDKSVHTVITSPPYWGKRDYGTASWIGGDPACDHKGEPFRTKRDINKNTNSGGEDKKNREGRQPMGRTCSKCGAKRQDNQIGLEPTVEQYVRKMVKVFREVRRVLRDDGTIWLNIANGYAHNGAAFGSESSTLTGRRQGPEMGMARRFVKKGKGFRRKDMIPSAWMVAMALQHDGWRLRSDIIWYKKNPMPESAKDRPTVAHEYIFMLSKKSHYYYDHVAVKEDAVEYEVLRRTKEFMKGLDTKFNISRDNKTGQVNQSETGAVRNARARQELAMSGKRNKRSVWETFDPVNFIAWIFEHHPEIVREFIRETLAIGTVWNINSKPFKDAHFATFPPELIIPAIKAGSSEHGCCANCGSPYKRILKPSERYKAILGQSYFEHDDQDLVRGKKKMRGTNKQNAMRDAGIPGAEYETRGWEKTCKCLCDEVVPAVVLDPFIGSGTTMDVSRRLGRNCVGIDLQPNYEKLRERRLRESLGMFAEVPEEKQSISNQPADPQVKMFE